MKEEFLHDNLFAIQQTQCQIRVTTEFSDSLPPIVGPRYGINFALKVLVQNAIDAMGSGGTLTFRTGFRNPQEDNSYRVVVFLDIQDSGTGIAAEIAEVLGKQPYRTTKREGTGLGVYSVKRFMQLHQGDLTFFRNEDGSRGTTFRLMFTQP